MPRVDVPLFQPITMRVDGGDAEHAAQVLDLDTETLLLRVPPDLASDDTPSEVMLNFGHKGFFWEVQAEARAVYDHWWFVARPDENVCRRYQRRAFVRIAFKSDQTAIQNDREGGMPVPVTTNNLSAGGALVSSTVPLGLPGDDVMMYLALPEMAPIPATSRIVRVGDRGRYGLQFRDLETDTQEQVAQFVAREIQKNLTKGFDITER